MIRDATAADVPRIVEMGQRFLRESHYAGVLSENPAQMASTAAWLIAEDAGFVAVDERGALVGMIGALLFRHHFSGELIAGEVFWWVEPASRGGGIRLMRRAEAWARARGAQRMQMIAPDAQVGQLYARLGYDPIEVAYERAL